MEKYTNNVLKTFHNKSNHVDCAKVCTSNCLSFTFDPVTKECQTFTSMFCRNDTAPKSSSVMLFTKVKTQIKNTADPADCSDVEQAIYCSGVYRITPSPGVSFDVYCEMDTPDGPWTVIQNREDGQVDFYRSWEDYKKGFGNLKGNFWLGNDAIHQLTIKASVLRIEIVTSSGDAGHAQYSTFSVGNEATNYRLTVSGFSGIVSYDGMAVHNGMSFSTFDRDNDQYPLSCAERFKGGWWYGGCYRSNLNGLSYTNGPDVLQTMVWFNFYSSTPYSSLTKTRMVVKRSTP
ncbi:angiopoietin-related protein 7-like [Pecten maximus]|uniref:angiopoietin-related protein 7-like n=1 Tax=Pecten maximus TaxID=6579 RepID=UPI001458EBA0|nr:angiopoietin-related protein 7-like [Pecten maximus]